MTTNVRDSSIVLIVVQNRANENLYQRIFQKENQAWVLIRPALVKQIFLFMTKVSLDFSCPKLFRP